MNERFENWRKVLLRHWQNAGRGLNTVDRVLRGRDHNNMLPVQGVSQERAAISVVMTLVAISGIIYGVTMGSFAGVIGHHDWSSQVKQMGYSAIKIPLLIAMTLATALPCYFVLNTLLGLRRDFVDSVHAIISAQAGLVLILAALAPLTLFVYVSLPADRSSYPLAVLWNAAVFGFASLTAQALLRRYYQTLIEKRPAHRTLMRIWIFLYAFVGIQAAYVLRPFVGNPGAEITFFRREPFENAYVQVVRLIWSLWLALDI